MRWVKNFRSSDTPNTDQAELIQLVALQAEKDAQPAIPRKTPIARYSSFCSLESSRKPATCVCKAATVAATNLRFAEKKPLNALQARGHDRAKLSSRRLLIVELENSSDFIVELL
jgi:hypothetical protein